MKMKAIRTRCQNRMTYKCLVDFAGISPPFPAVAIDEATAFHSEVCKVIKHKPVCSILVVVGQAN